MFASLSSASLTDVPSGQEASTTESLKLLHLLKRHSPALQKLPLKAKSQATGMLKTAQRTLGSSGRAELTLTTAQIQAPH